MDEKFIKGAAKLHYKENVEGEPLDQDTPIECFVAGAEFIIKSKKIHANMCNISKYSSYNLKKSNMCDTAKIRKILENAEKIDKITGFYITAPGDESVGILPATWKLENDFYFDSPEEIGEFKKELRGLFEFYCGEVTSVVTFEELQAEEDAQENAAYQEYPIRYLIKDGDNYKQAHSTASYSSDIGDGIHFKLPHWIDEDRNEGEDRVIKSSSKEYWKILRDAAGQLENEIRNEEYRLENAKRNLRLIQNEFKHRK